MRLGRLTAVLTALGMCMGMAGTSAGGLNTCVVQAGNYTNAMEWTYDGEGTLTITGSGSINAGYWNFPIEKVEHVIIKPGFTNIGDKAFYGFDSLKTVSIPATVRGIGISAFENCALTELTLPEGVEVMMMYAFANCKDLKKLSLPQSLTHMDSGAFLGCTSLHSVTLPDHLEQMDFNAFHGCTSLTEVLVSGDNQLYMSRNGVLYSPDGKTLLLYPAGKTAEHYRISRGVTAIGGHAFGGCEWLKTVVIPDTVTEIGRNTFSDCMALEMLVIPDSVLDIGTGLIDRSPNAVICCNSESAAEHYAQNFSLPYRTFWELPEETGVCGDVDLDSEVDVLDVIVLNKYILGVAELGNAALSNADANADGTVDAADSLVLLKYVVDLLNSLPFKN